MGAEARIDFVTDVSFSDAVLACLRMGQNRFQFRFASKIEREPVKPLRNPFRVLLTYKSGLSGPPTLEQNLTNT